MKIKAGVNADFYRVSDPQEFIWHGETGKLGPLSKGKYKLAVNVQPDAVLEKVFVRWVDKDKNLKTVESEEMGLSIVYELPIRISSHDPIYLTKYPYNNLRVFSTDSWGLLRIWEVAVVCHNRRDCYLTGQNTWIVQCYRSGAQVVCPRLGDWPQLQSLVQEVFQGLPDRLPWVGKYQKDPLPKPPTVRGTAGVLWYNVAMGYGLALTFDGKIARVDHNQLSHQDCLCLLREGDLLQYAFIRSRMGRVAWELDGVRILEQAVA